jgi:hypothetical protein
MIRESSENRFHKHFVPEVWGFPKRERELQSKGPKIDLCEISYATIS